MRLQFFRRTFYFLAFLLANQNISEIMSAAAFVRALDQVEEFERSHRKRCEDVILNSQKMIDEANMMIHDYGSNDDTQSASLGEEETGDSLELVDEKIVPSPDPEALKKWSHDITGMVCEAAGWVSQLKKVDDRYCKYLDRIMDEVDELTLDLAMLESIGDTIGTPKWEGNGRHFQFQFEELKAEFDRMKDVLETAFLSRKRVKLG